MALHPEAQKVVDESNKLPAMSFDAVTPAQMREGALLAFAGDPGPMAEVGAVVDRAVPGPAGEIPVRVYRPLGDGPFGVLVWMHGGGWTIGTLDENDAACRAVCRQAEVVVVSVDYRLAPEDPFPAAADDVYAVVAWVAEHADEIDGDGALIAVGGESAGGNLAAVAALMSRDRGGPEIALQVLVSPVLGAPEDGRASYDDYADGFFMSRSSMEWFFRQYPRDERDLKNPYLLPLAAEDLTGLAPALVMSAECDVLRDEALEYAARLAEAGVPTENIIYDGQIHGFFGLLVKQLSVSAEAHTTAARAIREAFAAKVGSIS